MVIKKMIKAKSLEEYNLLLIQEKEQLEEDLYIVYTRLNKMEQNYLEALNIIDRALECVELLEYNMSYGKGYVDFGELIDILKGGKNGTSKHKQSKNSKKSACK